MADNKKIIKCPACHKTMTKIFVHSANVNVDICLNGCGGIYFDNMEFYAFDENKENMYEITKALEGRKFQKVDQSKERLCPIKKKKMVKNFTNLSKNVEVDDCYNCGGKFLDFGELETIRKESLTAGERRKEFLKNVFSSPEYNVDTVNPPKYRRHRRSLMKRIFDRIFFGR